MQRNSFKITLKPKKCTQNIKTKMKAAPLSKYLFISYTRIEALNTIANI